MEFHEIVKARYATKKFDGQSIPDEEIERLFEIIRFAPSSYNIQPWRIIVITDPKMKGRLREASWDQPQITTCSHLLVFCADTDIEARIDLLAQAVGEAGVGYIDVMRNFAKGLKGEKRLAWCQRQCYLALANAVNGAKSLGFDSCPMEGFEGEKYRKILALDEDIHPSALCAVGYAADEPREKYRFPRDIVFDETYA